MKIDDKYPMTKIKHYITVTGAVSLMSLLLLARLINRQDVVFDE